jgi:DNA-binding NarL/FixJ family response regulator
MFGLSKILFLAGFTLLTCLIFVPENQRLKIFVFSKYFIFAFKTKNMKATSAKKPTMILVDDHLIFRQGLKSLITFENIGTVIGEASDGNEFIKLLSVPYPDLVIMDIDMPHMNGMEATRKALELTPELKIIVFSMFGDEEYYSKMVELGVKGFILKSSGITEVEKAIQEVMQGNTYFSSTLPKITINKLNLQKTPEQNENPIPPIPWW